MSHYALSIRGLTKFFEAGVAGCSVRVRVLDRVDLRVCPGEIVVIGGAAGAGKTTLLRCAAGLLSADHGFVESDRERVALLDEPFVARDTGALARLTLLVRRWTCDGAAVIIASRSPMVTSVATRAYTLARGRLSASSCLTREVAPVRVAERHALR